MRIFSDLLFLHGHLTNADLARQLAGEAPTSAAKDARDRPAKGTPPQPSPLLRKREGVDPCTLRPS